MPARLCPHDYARRIMPARLCPTDYDRRIMPDGLCQHDYARTIMPARLTAFVEKVLLCKRPKDVWKTIHRILHPSPQPLRIDLENILPQQLNAS